MGDIQGIHMGRHCFLFLLIAFVSSAYSLGVASVCSELVSESKISGHTLKPADAFAVIIDSKNPAKAVETVQALKSPRSSNSASEMAVLLEKLDAAYTSIKSEEVAAEITGLFAQALWSGSSKNQELGFRFFLKHDVLTESDLAFADIRYLVPFASQTGAVDFLNWTKVGWVGKSGTELDHFGGTFLSLTEKANRIFFHVSRYLDSEALEKAIQEAWNVPFSKREELPDGRKPYITDLELVHLLASPERILRKTIFFKRDETQTYIPVTPEERAEILNTFQRIKKEKQQGN